MADRKTTIAEEIESILNWIADTDTPEDETGDDSSKPTTIHAILADQYERSRSFMSFMEDMRWRLTSGLGIGAIASLATVTVKAKDAPVEITACVLVAIAVAGLIIQVRIIDLFWEAWRKMVVIQHAQVAVLQKHIGPHSMPPELEYNLVIPDIFSPQTTYGKSVSVHTANCIIFAAFLGAAVAMLSQSAGYCLLVSGSIGLVACGLACCWSCRAGEKLLYNPENIPSFSDIVRQRGELIVPEQAKTGR